MAISVIDSFRLIDVVDRQLMHFLTFDAGLQRSQRVDIDGAEICKGS
jgi:hypothetical protein